MNADTTFFGDQSTTPFFFSSILHSHCEIHYFELGVSAFIGVHRRLHFN